MSLEVQNNPEKDKDDSITKDISPARIEIAIYRRVIADGFIKWVRRAG
jgi:hypothetical protein